MRLTWNPLDYGFRWTADWYEFDDKAAEAAAKNARDLEAKRLKAQGKKVKKFREGNNLMSKGGIGSNHPHIEVIVTVYGLRVE